MKCRRKPSRPQRSWIASHTRSRSAIPAHVTEQDEAGAEPFSKRADVRLGLFVQVGNLKVRTELSKRHGTAEGDALVVGDSGQETAFAVEREFCVKGSTDTG